MFIRLLLSLGVKDSLRTFWLTLKCIRIITFRNKYFHKLYWKNDSVFRVKLKYWYKPSKMERSFHLLTIRFYCCCSRGYLLRPRDCLLFVFAIGHANDYLITLGPLKDVKKSQVKFFKKRYSYINIYSQECLTRIFLIINFVSYKQ